MPSTLESYAARDTPDEPAIPPLNDLWTDTERDIMRDVFRLARDHYTIIGNKAYWEELARHAGEIVMKYDLNPFAMDMCMAVVGHFNDKWVAYRKAVEERIAQLEAQEAERNAANTTNTERKDREESCRQLSMLS